MLVGDANEKTNGQLEQIPIFWKITHYTVVCQHQQFDSIDVHFFACFIEIKRAQFADLLHRIVELSY